MFDADGYFLSIFEAEKASHPDACFELALSDDPSVRDLHELYYLVARASMVPLGAGDPEPKVIEAWYQWRQTCYHISSAALTLKHLSAGDPVKPRWFKLYFDPLSEVLVPKYPVLRHVILTVTMEPRFRARALSNTRVQVSGLTRTFLAQYNLSLWNNIEADVVAETDLLAPTDVREAARMILPYLIYGHDFIPASRLPVSGSLRSGLFLASLVTTKLQTMFILAHELGHIALGHLGRQGLSSADTRAMERDADVFAFQALLDVARSGEPGTVGDVWTAVRWLHQYQILDEVVGLLLAGEAVDLEALSFEPRKNAMLGLLPKNEVQLTDSLLETRGTMMLLELKHQLMRKGSGFLREIADELSTPVPGVLAKWWERFDVAEAHVVSARDGSQKIMRRKT